MVVLWETENHLVVSWFKNPTGCPLQ